MSSGLFDKRAEAVPRIPRTLASSSASANALAVTGSIPLMFSRKYNDFCSTVLFVSLAVSTIRLTMRIARLSVVTNLPKSEALKAIPSALFNPASPLASLAAFSISSEDLTAGIIALLTMFLSRSCSARTFVIFFVPIKPEVTSPPALAAFVTFPTANVGSAPMLTAASINPERMLYSLEPGVKKTSAASRPIVQALPLIVPRKRRARSACFSAASPPKNQPDPDSDELATIVPNCVDLNQPSKPAGSLEEKICEPIFCGRSGIS